MKNNFSVGRSFLIIAFCLQSSILYSTDSNIISQTRILTNKLLNLNESDLDSMFDFPLKDENLIMGYNLLFDSDLKELNKKELFKFLNKTIKTNTDYYNLLSIINYDSLFINSEDCKLLYKNSIDTCNLMCCIKIRENLVMITFTSDNTSDLLEQEINDNLQGKEECNEFMEEFVFEFRNRKFKFKNYNIAG